MIGVLLMIVAFVLLCMALSALLTTPVGWAILTISGIIALLIIRNEE